jgi:hypothetical protein
MPHFKNLSLVHPVSNKSNFNVDILIGAYYYWDIVGDQVIHGRGPTAVQSKIGYLIFRWLDNSNDTINQSVLNLHISVEEKFDVARFWQLETIGIKPDMESTQ